MFVEEVFDCLCDSENFVVFDKVFDLHSNGAAAIDLLERPEVAVGMTGRARKEVAERYTWTSVLDSWRRCYGSLGEVA